MMKRLTVILLMASALSACKDSEPTHDVQYYLDHPKERAEKLAECENNPGEKAIATNCINAAQADLKAKSRSQEMPAIPDLTKGRR
ncbi:EexN family lipoprotein [Bordetella parapertussis]|uniref:Entry exclusion protein n=1 Tax=Bordetella parapertussis (strain Bpp5) TaxID=1208660 RepID=K0MPY6_BORPB|nr:EexN family lipoprotein [Bordetella parapertussis]CCJ51899.1 entry exclusion protein [Bordetella parapertussis Bpp5]